MKKIYLIFSIIFILLLVGCDDVKNHQVKFMNDDELVDTYVIKDGKTIGQLPTISKEGYDFIGWSYNDVYLTAEYIVRKDITVEAVFESDEITYNVTFLDFDDSILSEEKVIEFDDATAPTPPTRLGYEFTGWDGDYTLILTDTILKAKYKIINYTIKYYNGIQEIKNLVLKNYNIETSATLPSYSLSGYEFLGWFTDKDYTEQIEIIIPGETGNLVLYAKMEIIPLLEIEVDTVTMAVGDTQQIKLSDKAIATGIRSNLGDYTIVSSNTNAITVSTSGELTAIGLGKTTITVSYNDLVATIEITVADISNDPFNVNNNQVTLNSSVTRDMTNPYYWINKVSDYGKILMTQTEIAEYNRKCLNNLDPYTTSKKTGFIDITAIGESETGTNVKALIQASINAAPTSTYNNNSNISTVPVSVTVQYGLIVKVASMKNVPTLASTGTNNKYQETGLEVGEAVIIYHTSTDGLWYFVQAYNYNGWVLKTDIALCSRTEMLDYFNASDFAMVTCERLTTPVDIRMGTKLPIVSTNGSKVTVKIPTRNSSGILVMTNVEYTIEKENLSIGYLTYTTQNLLKQMFKMIGQPYDWGDEHGGRDCSSTLDAAYKCMGFLMPRNTSSIVNLNGQRYDLNGKTDAQKTELLKTLRPGTIVLKSGHVMMYAGYEGNNCYIIHNVSGGVNVSTCTHSSAPINTYTVFIEMFNE